MENLAIKLQEAYDRSKRNEKRIEQLETDQKALNELTLSVQELVINQSNMKSDIMEIKCDIKEITDIPSERWEKVIETVLSVVVGAFIAWIIASA